MTVSFGEMGHERGIEGPVGEMRDATTVGRRVDRAEVHG